MTGLQPLIAGWITFAVAMIGTPVGRRALRKTLRDVRRALGLTGPSRAVETDPQEDLAERRSRAVEDAYVRGDFGPEELDWRCLLALQPPDPLPRQIHEETLREAMTRRHNYERYAHVVPVSSANIPWTSTPGEITHVIPWTAAAIPIDDTEPVTLYDANGNTQSIVRRRKAFADSEWKRLHEGES